METAFKQHSSPYLDDNEVYIKVYGAVELESKWGRVIENRARQPLPWLLLKYLLMDPQREAHLDELIATIWPPSETDNDIGAARVRVRRLREMLEPLKLDGTKGLILYCNGKFSLNPQYDIKTDVDTFNDLM